MPREIKFRAWDKENKRMIYNTWKDLGFHLVIMFNGELRIQNGTGSSGIFGIENFLLLQFTGLLDKNGKEIFEGDILKGENTSIMVVVPMLGGLSLLPLRNIGQEYNELIASPTNDAQTSSWLRDSAVIGNIFENPELLEAEDAKT